jgi:stearoyl-CoA desaturase (Delta-9 desaturase)
LVMTKSFFSWTSKVDWKSALFLSLTPIGAVLGLAWYLSTSTFDPRLLVLFIVFYFASGMSITAGYHRLFAHKAYEASWPVRLFFILMGAGAFQNSVIKWVADHRVHHRYVDRDKDPYNAKRGFWYSHIGWLFLKSPANSPEVWTRDLLRDPLIRWQHKHYDLIAVLMGFGLPALIGWMMGSALGGLVFGGLIRVVFVHHMTFFINSLCHILGSQPYSDTHTAKDNGVLAIFTYGEGYHNFHHQFDLDYRNGIRWYNYDPTKWLIAGLSYVNLTTNLRVTPVEEIVWARMIMDEKKLKKKAANIPSELYGRLEVLRVKSEVAMEHCRKVRAEYQEFSKQVKHRRDEALLQMKSDLSEAQDRLVEQYQAWKRLTRSMAKAT